jgi:excisionase family DNA binding protein
MEPLAVDLREAGRLLSISPRTVRRQILQGRLPVLRIGRRILIPLDSLRNLLRERRDG